MPGTLIIQRMVVGGAQKPTEDAHDTVAGWYTSFPKGAGATDAVSSAPDGTCMLCKSVFP